MSEEQAHPEKEEHGKKEFTIIVNSTPKPWNDDEISYDQVVKLAFPNAAPNEEFTVAYTMAEGKKKDGNLVKGQKVRITNGTSFDVDKTTNS
jgi:hypothetical protein